MSHSHNIENILLLFHSRAIFFIPEWIIFAPLINPCTYKFEYFWLCFYYSYHFGEEQIIRN